MNNSTLSHQILTSNLYNRAVLIDKVEVLFKAGKGGAGKSSFRRNQKAQMAGMAAAVEIFTFCHIQT